MARDTYLAIDLGAGSGRTIAGTLSGGRLTLDELHRFANRPVDLGGTLYWDFLALFANIKEGMREAAARGYEPRGVAVDTWGVDFGLVDRHGRMLSNPVCYRDSRTAGMIPRAEEMVSREEFYRATGIQQMEINTVYQLLSMRLGGDPTLDAASRLLFTPDLVNYYLSGVASCEYTIASTSQMMNVRSGRWDAALLSALDLPAELLQDIVPPGSVLGELLPQIASETGCAGTRVFAVGSHDTASAIAAIPEEGNDWAFLSSGTWSLLGVAAGEPTLTPQAMGADFTNEGGVDGKILFMRNITGLWLLQRLAAEWEQEDGRPPDFPALIEECAASEPFGPVVDTDHPSFTYPDSMARAIAEFCLRSGQRVPESRGEYVRCVLESLAVKYRSVLDKLGDCCGRRVTRLAVVGGGGRNAMLNQFTANILGIELVSGLNEATAVGNIMQQAIADGRVRDWTEGHEIIGRSFEFRSFLPQEHERWSEFYRAAQGIVR